MDQVQAALGGARDAFESSVLQYMMPDNQWLPSSAYKFEDPRPPCQAWNL
jgi:hypothetical protein